MRTYIEIEGTRGKTPQKTRFPLKPEIENMESITFERGKKVLRFSIMQPPTPSPLCAGIVDITDPDKPTVVDGDKYPYLRKRNFRLATQTGGHPSLQVKVIKKD